ncbi:MAG: hypothetical protein ABI234_09720 [Ktedonobacteraceae bacterium]
MTQHLKTCKARLSAKEEGEEQRLFHLFVEGTYRPDYWMHLEVPAAVMLVDLDDFLRDIWLECCGHLSEFTIKGTTYASVTEDNWGLGMLEEGDELGVNGGSEQSHPSAETIATQITDNLSTELHAELKDIPVAQIEEKLVEMLSENMPPGVPSLSSPEFRPFLNYMATALQQGTLAEEMGEMEEMEEDDGEMYVTLDDVLAVDDTFSYIYDFGSSTNLSFRVIAEREGALPAHLLGEDDEEDDDEEDDEEDEEDEDNEELEIIVIARNEPPALRCQTCGKPATHIMPEADALDEAGLCDEHAQEQEDPSELLPVVNSPRVGVCGYTGGEGEEDAWDDDEEEEE